MKTFRFISFLILIFYLINSSYSLSVNDQDYKDILLELKTKKSVKIIIELQSLNKSLNITNSKKNSNNPLGILSNKKEKDKKNKHFEYKETEIEKMENETISKLNLTNDKIKKSTRLPFIVLEINNSNIGLLLNISQVKSIKKDKILFPSLAQSLPIIGANTTQSLGYGGEGQTIVILDTGFEKTHQMLLGKVISEACYSTNGGGSTSLCPGGVSSSIATGSAAPCSFHANCDHGTHVAGIAIGNNGTYFGVAPNSTMVGIKVFSNIGGALGAYTSDMILGLERAYNLTSTYNISAVSISIGGGLYTSSCDVVSPSFKAAVDSLKSVGVPVFIASGNDYNSTAISFPACISSAISVGSTTDSDTISSFSNSASILDILAPGSLIYSATVGNSFVTKSGTSMATPHVAGAFSVLKSANPTASLDQIYNALISTGTPITDSRNSITKPRINLDKALQNVLVNLWQGGVNVLDIKIFENIFENVIYNPIKTGSGLFFNSNENQSLYNLNGTIVIKNSHSTQSIENIDLFFTNVADIYNVSWISGSLGYIVLDTNTNLDLNIPDLGPGKNVTFTYSINSSNVAPPLNFTSSYGKNKVLAGSSFRIYDTISNNLNPINYPNSCIFDINISQKAMAANISNSIYNFTYSQGSLLGSDSSNATISTDNLSLNWKPRNYNCLNSSQMENINYLFNTPSQINISNNYYLINSSINFKLNDSFSKINLFDVSAFVDLDLNFQKYVNDMKANNATWEIISNVTNPSNITVNLEKVSLWVSSRNGTGTGFTNPSIKDNDTTTGATLLKTYYPNALLNNSNGGYNNLGSTWLFDYTYSPSPIVWMDVVGKIVNNGIQINGSSISSANNNNIYLKEIYISSGYWLKISKNITKLSDDNFNVHILLENLGTDTTPSDQVVVVYNFIPNFYNLTSPISFTPSTWYNVDNTNTTLNTITYNGTMFQWALLPTNSKNASLDKFSGTINFNNSFEVSYNVSGSGDFSYKDLFLTGVDPLHVESEGSISAIVVESFYTSISENLDYVLGIGALVIGTLILIL